MFKNLILSGTFLFFMIVLSGQVVWVYDASTLQPVENVYVFSGSGSSLTDLEGRVELVLLDSSEVVHFQHPGYKNVSLVLADIREMSFKVFLEERVIKMEEIIVSANSWEQHVNEVPNKVVALLVKEVEDKNWQTTADLLGSSGHIFVQKSQLGGGSPMIRGFAANRVLIVVDGVRMNNAIFRSGNLQNVIAIDGNALEGTEVIMGPGSVVYGSDALGGVMDFHSLRPKLSTNTKLFVKGQAFARYASASDERTGHFHASAGGKNFSVLTSFTSSRFRDLRMGSRGNKLYQREEYVVRKGDSDVVLKNMNKDLQKFSGYEQFNMLNKLRFKKSNIFDLTYGWHFSTTTDIPRYDRLIRYKNKKLRYGDWYYGPQKWGMHVLNAIYKPNLPFADKVGFTVAYQRFEESRHSRLLDSLVIKEQFEKVDAYSVGLDVDKSINESLSFFYGFEYVFNRVGSHGRKRNIVSGILNSHESRYPDGSLYSSSAIYSIMKYKLTKSLVFNTGLRYSYTDLKANFDKGFYSFPFDGIRIGTGALNGSFGFVYSTANGDSYRMNFSSGFRAPNVDDAAKVFDSQPGRVIVPNKNLKDEYAYNVDLGVSFLISSKFKVESSVFGTLLKDAMVRSDYSYGGKDSILYEGEMSKVNALVNKTNAYLLGFQLGAFLDLFDCMYLSSHLNYTWGEDSDSKPLRHISPLFGKVLFMYHKNKWKVSFFSAFNGEIPYSRLNDDERKKPYMYAKNDEGMPYSPSWFTLNMQLNYQLNRTIRLNMAVENIMDKRYRPYSSGIVAAGRNYIMGIRIYF